MAAYLELLGVLAGGKVLVAVEVAVEMAGGLDVEKAVAEHNSHKNTPDVY